jgi:hypothetical protein
MLTFKRLAREIEHERGIMNVSYLPGFPFADIEPTNFSIIVTADNGMPFPRAKANCYEYGIHVPTAACWPARARGGRTVDDLVGFVDYGPTFLEAAGLRPPETMAGRSFLRSRRTTTEEPGSSTSRSPRDAPRRRTCAGTRAPRSKSPAPTAGPGRPPRASRPSPGRAPTRADPKSRRW